MPPLARSSGRVWSLMRSRSHLCASMRRYSSSSQDEKKTDENKIYLPDTLALIKRLEAQGLPTNQAETIIKNITDCANNNLKHMTRLFASKPGLEKFEVVQSSTLTQFISEMKNMQENNFQKIKYEIEKMDLKFLSKFDQETTLAKFEIEKVKKEITSKFDREIPAAKFEIIKYCIGSFVSVATISLAIVRFWMK